MRPLPPLPRITAYRKAGRRQVLTDEGVQAMIVQWWLDGYLQRDIAKVFGYAKSPPIAVLIREFIVRHMPELYRPYHDSKYLMNERGFIGGDDRKCIGHEALRRYRAKHIPFRLVVSR